MRLEYLLLLIIPVLLIAGCTQQAQAPQQPVPPAVNENAPLKEFTLEADDNGFYPSSIINVNKGDRVRLTFTIRTVNTYYAGLEVRSDFFGTGQVPQGQSKTVEFMADRSFEFTSHWPSTNVLKSAGQVIVS